MKKEDYLALCHESGSIIVYACMHCGAYAAEKVNIRHFPMCTLQDKEAVDVTDKEGSK